MILERYLARYFLQGYFLVLLVLLALFSFFDLVDELSEVGKGQYRIPHAFWYVLSTLPSKWLELSPVCVLIGGGYALSGLARGGELLAMRALGMSASRIALALLKTTLFLALGLTFVAQFIAPRSHQWGVLYRQQALAGEDSLRTAQGFWSRDQKRFLQVASLLHGRVPLHVNIYEFAEDGRLLEFLHAERADIQADGEWWLRGVTLKRWQEGGLKTERFQERKWRSFLSPRQLKVLELPAETLSLSDLWGYANHLKASGQRAERYMLLFWQQLLLPLSMAVMIPLLLPVMLIAPRAKEFTLQVAFSLLIGVLYFLGAQVVGNAGLLLGLPAWLTALVPPLAMLLLAGGVKKWGMSA
jgi:lipopolysaccharide export system permease protein